MEFFIPSIPASADDRQIRKALSAVFSKHGIYAFQMYNWKDRHQNRKSARVIIHDALVGKEILQKYGSQPLPPRVNRGAYQYRGRGNPGNEILISGFRIDLRQNIMREQIDLHVIKALRSENARKATRLANRQPEERKPYRRPIPFVGLECGVWTTDPRHSTMSTYSSFYSNPLDGNFRLTKSAVQVDVSRGHRYILCNSVTIRSAIITRDDEGAYFTVSMYHAPRFYQKSVTSSLLPNGTIKMRTCKLRLPFLDEDHKKISPYCFVYRFKLRDAHDAIRILTIGNLTGFVDVSEAEVLYQKVLYDFQKSMTTLDEQLLSLPFGVSFQLQALAYNGLLLPHRVKEILGVVRRAIRDHGPEITARVLQYWVDNWQTQIHSDPPHSWLQESIINDFNTTLKQRFDSTKKLIEMRSFRLENQLLVHRVVISPAGIYLMGPSPEPNNRVLRRYSNRTDHFIRVILMDEDGNDLRFERGVDGKVIYSERFLPLLMQESRDLRIAGRNYTFLGFSQSSLRSHAAWFMAPFWDSINTPARYLTVETLIKDLGDFGDIKIPGKCAARIGQAFTDTIANIAIIPGMMAYTQDVTRQVGNRKYTFSDGCGTISIDLLRKIWKKGKFNLDRFQPTIFQIRLNGAKGVVSLDSTLRDEQIKLRKSMIKFNATNHNTFEICLSVLRPLPFYLNRQLVKILEDRGVPKSLFMSLQQDVLIQLKKMSQSPDFAAYFLETQGRCKPSEMPFLIRELHRLGFNYQEDYFLRQVVEFSMMNTLRDLKYRARIPVKSGYTLMGILDETRYLQEGQIYCPIKEEDIPGEPKKPRWAITGRVAIARSPALHPGDVQVVEAVDVPYSSPLHNLTNCVVFSQFGDRDLPNMLAGGDLDGDLYHVWWDKRLIPTRPALPADYKPVTVEGLDRPVTQADIGQFFLDFMENDKLGVISVAHMVLADQMPNGTYSPECLKCAQLASDAVDFPKTGKPVNLKDLPRITNVRPDFLAPGPRLLLSKNNFHLKTNDEEDSDDEDEPTAGPDADDPFAVSRQFIYYESQNALGHLFREIDEFKFVEIWERMASTYEANGPNHLLLKVCRYLLTKANLTEVHNWAEFAEHLRISYENNIHELTIAYAPRRDKPLEEVEVFIGSIIGTESHRQTRYQKENSEPLRAEVHRLISHIMTRIRHGAEDDVVEEGSYDGFTLERAVMCVMDSLTARQDGVQGRSFGWLAAAVALKELQKRGVQKSAEEVILASLQSQFSVMGFT